MGFLQAILNRMQSSRASVRDWSCLHKVNSLFSLEIHMLKFFLFQTLLNCCRLGDLIRIREQRPAILTELAENFGKPIHEMCELLAQIVSSIGLTKL